MQKSRILRAGIIILVCLCIVYTVITHVHIARASKGMFQWLTVYTRTLADELREIAKTGGSEDFSFMLPAKSCTFLVNTLGELNSTYANRLTRHYLKDVNNQFYQSIWLYLSENYDAVRYKPDLLDQIADTIMDLQVAQRELRGNRFDINGLVSILVEHRSKIELIISP